jgi:uncharacterized BrkB/YihY/UPF0761 family membrane protein
MRPLATSEEFDRSLRLLIGAFVFYWVAVLLLMLGLGRQVSEYGWTNQRAALGFLALWMLAIAIYYWHPNRRRLSRFPFHSPRFFW